MKHDSNIMQWVAECLRGCFWVRFRDHTIIHEIRATTRRMKRARLARVVKFEIRTSFLLQMLDYYIGSQHRFPFVFIFFFLNLPNFLSTLWSHCIRFGQHRVTCQTSQILGRSNKNTPLHVETVGHFYHMCSILFVNCKIFGYRHRSAAWTQKMLWKNEGFPDAEGIILHQRWTSSCRSKVELSWRNLFSYIAE